MGSGWRWYFELWRCKEFCDKFFQVEDKEWDGWRRSVGENYEEDRPVQKEPSAILRIGVNYW